jgi:N-dimethylarginine dimethylaminohydrolase
VTAAVTPRAVLMGAPDFFSIRGGANPHTRTALGRKKRVRRDVAIEQWHRFAARLVDLGVAVYAVPPDPSWPGLVYPANAGVLFPLEEPLPLGAKRFVLSNLIASRSGEQSTYRAFLESLGLPTVSMRSRFEGEADFFPAGDDLYLFTHGAIVRQRFAPRWGIPPWVRRYGFRSELAALEELRRFVPDREVLALELRLEAFYHGDTCLAAFGAGRRFVLAYLDALTPASRDALRARLRDRLLTLSESDAALYAANAFRLSTTDGERLFLPAGVSERLQHALRDRGVTPELVDVSEFWSKGGGSVKCMIGDLGPADVAETAAIAAFRDRVRYRGGSSAMPAD